MEGGTVAAVEDETCKRYTSTCPTNAAYSYKESCKVLKALSSCLNVSSFDIRKRLLSDLCSTLNFVEKKSKLKLERTLWGRLPFKFRDMKIERILDELNQTSSMDWIPRVRKKWRNCRNNIDKYQHLYETVNLIQTKEYLITPMVIISPLRVFSFWVIFSFWGRFGLVFSVNYSEWLRSKFCPRFPFQYWSIYFAIIKSKDKNWRSVKFCP